MAEWMIKIFDMSAAAGGMVMVVLVLRLLFFRIPKSHICLLWGLVMIRFLIPVTFPTWLPVSLPSPAGLLSLAAESLGQEFSGQESFGQELFWQNGTRMENQTVFLDDFSRQDLAGEDRHADDPGGQRPGGQPSGGQHLSEWDVRMVLSVCFLVWAAAACLLAVFYLAGYWRLRRRLRTAIQAEPGVYETDQISGAFVFGAAKPAIYLPAGLGREERRMILLHERAHLARKDHLIKLAGLWMVCVHWFSPLAWIAFRFLCRDMEMACDERVIRSMETDEKKTYSKVLLAAAAKESGLRFSLSFRESNTRLRIRHIFRYRKPKFWAAAALAAGLVIVAAGFLSGPEPARTGRTDTYVIGGADGPTSIFIAGKTDGEEPAWNEWPELEWLLDTTVPTVFSRETAADPQRTQTDGQTSTPVTIDLATDTELVFHGAFGLFAFQKENGRWEPTLCLTDPEVITEEMVTQLAALMGKQDWESEDSIHPEDRLKKADTGGAETGFGHWIEADVAKRNDGTIAMLGGYETDEQIRLVDLFYGYYDPQDQIFHQAYLFCGDRQEYENPAGEFVRQRYLFSRDGVDYYVRTPRSQFDFESQFGDTFDFPYGRMELMGANGTDAKILDSMMLVGSAPDSQKVILTRDRLVYTAAQEQSEAGMSKPCLVSIALDGSDRRIANIPHQVYDNLFYEEEGEQEYLYFDGWASPEASERPRCRITPDFARSELVELVPSS